MEKDLENLCWWKTVSDERDLTNDLPKFMVSCKYKCDGYNSDCKDYVSDNSFKKR